MVTGAIACEVPNHPISIYLNDAADDMDDFDTLTMPYMASSLPVGLLPHTDYLQPASGMDFQDQLSNIDTETYMRLAGRPRGRFDSCADENPVVMN